MMPLDFFLAEAEKQGPRHTREPSYFRQISAKPGEEPATTLSPEEFGRIATEHDMILRPPAEE